MKNIVSLWTGKFKNRKEFQSYIQENFDDEGDFDSKFMNDFKIEYYDSDFQEAEYLEKQINLQDFENASYSKSFINKLTNIDFRNDNSIILVYDFEYNKAVIDTNKIRFIGNFEYEKI